MSRFLFVFYVFFVVDSDWGEGFSRRLEEVFSFPYSVFSEGMEGFASAWRGGFDRQGKRMKTHHP